MTAPQQSTVDIVGQQHQMDDIVYNVSLTEVVSPASPKKLHEHKPLDSEQSDGTSSDMAFSDMSVKQKVRHFVGGVHDVVSSRCPCGYTNR